MNNKGFTLAEMVAVVAVLMILALVSTPFVRSYIDDAYFGKAQVFLRQLNEARMNFEKDYPGFTVFTAEEKEGRLQPLAEGDTTPCDIFGIYQTSGTNVLSSAELLRCHYIKFPNELNGRYNFYIDKLLDKCSDYDGTGVVGMLGTSQAGKYDGKCVYIDNLGNIVNPEE